MTKTGREGVAPSLDWRQVRQECARCGHEDLCVPMDGQGPICPTCLDQCASVAVNADSRAEDGLAPWLRAVTRVRVGSG